MTDAARLRSHDSGSGKGDSLPAPPEARQAARPGRPPKRRDQRQRILQTAARLIATVGYEQCSIADIASELELTPPALYHYFPTKQSIFTEVAMTAMRGTYDAVRNAVRKELPAAEQLEALMVAHADHFDSNYWLVNATISAYAGITRREIERIEEFERLRRKNLKVLLGVLRGGIKSGEFREFDCHSMARSIYQLLNITRWYRPGGKRNAVEFARDNYELVIGGLRAAA